MSSSPAPRSSRHNRARGSAPARQVTQDIESPAALHYSRPAPYPPWSRKRAIV
jgi:hypothetical protein